MAPAPPRGLPALLEPLVALGLGLTLALRLFASGAAAEVSEPSINLAVHGVLAATVVTWALRAALLGEAALPRARVAAPLAVLVATAWLSLGVAEDPAQAVRRAIDWSADAALLVLLLAFARGGRGARAGLLAALLAGAAVLLGLAWKERLVDIEAARASFVADPSSAGVPGELAEEFRARLFTDQVSGPFVIPNALGALLAAAALAAGGAALGILRALRRNIGPFDDRSDIFATSPTIGAVRAAALIAGALAAGLAGSVSLAAQKGPWLALAAGAGVAVLAALGPARRLLARVALLAGAAAGALAVVAVASTPTERLESLPGGTSIAVRKDYARTALRMIAEAPLRGEGAGNFGLQAGRFKPDRGEETRYAHMDYLEVAAEQGVLAGLALAALWVALLWAPRRRPSSAHPERSAAEGRAESNGRSRSALLAEAALPVGFTSGILLLLVLGIRFRELFVLVPAAAAFAVVHAVLTGPLRRALGLRAARRAIVAGCAGAAAAFALQASIDFLHVESGLLACALGWAAVARAPLAARRRALAGPWRALLPLAAIAAFAALSLEALPAAILADEERGRSDDAMRAGDLRGAVEHAAAAVDAMPYDPALQTRLGDALAEMAARAPTASAALELRRAAAERYRAAVDGRRALSDVKERLANVLPEAERAAAYLAAVEAYPAHPRRRYLAGRALAREAARAAASQAPDAPALAARAARELAEALRLDPLARQERLRLTAQERADARASLDRLRAPPYHGRPEGR